MTWQAGDLALCVGDGPCSCSRGCPCEPPFEAGKIYRVAGFRTDWQWPLVMMQGAIETGYSHGERGWWSSDRFRKILPDEHEACEEEFVTLLRKSKQKVSA